MKIVALCTLLALGACSTTGTPASVCWDRIFWTKADADVISDRLASGLLTHETFGKERGCWK